MFGVVTSVGDADNFRLFHTPGGRLAGWGWWFWKKVPTTREGLAKNTVCISQPYSHLNKQDKTMNLGF
jgi:hypothetical protein